MPEQRLLKNFRSRYDVIKDGTNIKSSICSNLR